MYRYDTVAKVVVSQCKLHFMLAVCISSSDLGCRPFVVFMQADTEGHHSRLQSHPGNRSLEVTVSLEASLLDNLVEAARTREWAAAISCIPGWFNRINAHRYFHLLPNTSTRHAKDRIFKPGRGNSRRVTACSGQQRDVKLPDFLPTPRHGFIMHGARCPMV